MTAARRRHALFMHVHAVPRRQQINRLATATVHPASCHTPPLQHHSPRGAVRATRDRGACVSVLGTTGGRGRAVRGWEGEGGREGGINRVDDDCLCCCKTTNDNHRRRRRVLGSVRTMPIPGAAQWRQQPAICRLREERLGSSEQCNMRRDAMLCDAMRCTLRVRAVGSWGLLYRGLD